MRSTLALLHGMAKSFLATAATIGKQELAAFQNQECYLLQAVRATVGEPLLKHFLKRVLGAAAQSQFEWLLLLVVVLVVVLMFLLGLACLLSFSCNCCLVGSESDCSSSCSAKRQP